MKHISIAIIFLILPSICWSADPWDKSDKILCASWMAVQFVDWRQTINIANNGDRYFETNPIIGKHPSRGRVNTYFIVDYAVTLTIAHFLPSKWRKVWLGYNLGSSTALVIHNHSIGLRMAW